MLFAAGVVGVGVVLSSSFLHEENNTVPSVKPNKAVLKMFVFIFWFNNTR